MKEFHFSKKYFNKLIYNDLDSNISVIIEETPSLDISEEDYSLRIETHHEEDIPLHRKYAIEHHSKQDKHNFPHLQFKFHTEEIGAFWLRLNFENQEEYKSAILGFIYKIKDILKYLEKFKQGISEEILVLGLVNSLSEEGDFLSKKISESIAKYQLEFQDKESIRNKVINLTKNPLLVDFLGKENIIKVIEMHNKKK